MILLYLKDTHRIFRLDSAGQASLENLDHAIKYLNGCTSAHGEVQGDTIKFSCSEVRLKHTETHVRGRLCTPRCRRI